MSSQAVLDFIVRTVMPAADIEEIDAQHPGYLDAVLSGAISEIYSRLRKRYKTPMNPIPEVVMMWQALLATPQAYSARGTNPNDPTVEVLEKAADRAREQMKEAADSKDGLYDLPLLDAADASGISKGGPLSYSEQSPYIAFDEQAIVGRQEDDQFRRQ